MKINDVLNEGLPGGEYSRVLTALKLYYPNKFSMEELNTPEWHRVIANKADVPMEYAGDVIDGFVKASQRNDDDDGNDEGHDYWEPGKGWGVEKDTPEGLNEFSPAGSGGGGNTPRGPRTPRRDPWDGDDSGQDPYSRPEPEYYSRSIDYFGQFEADHFDDEEFDKATGVFKGYWDDEEGRVQIGYFKFDDPAATGSDDPGMGWYYEPQNESVAEGSEEHDIVNSRLPIKHIERKLQEAGLEKDIRIFLQWAIDNGSAYIEDAIELGEKAKLNDPQLSIGLHRLKKLSAQGVAEGLPQTLRKIVPGYAKREIDKKMDAQKFGRDDVDKDANYYRYKKIQDKLKGQGVAEGSGDVGNTIRQLYQQFYDQGDDALEYLNTHAPLFAQFWDQYEGDLDSIIAEVSPKNLIRIAQELKQIAGEQGVAEGKPREKEADYGDDYQDMVARVKKLAGMGPLRTVYDPQKRVYKNVPVAVQPAQQPKK